jgi:S1-C subfamily serine protease
MKPLLVVLLLALVTAPIPSAEAQSVAPIPASIEGKSFLLGGDIILAVQGREIGSETYEALQARLRSLPAGSIVTVVVLREGRPVTLQAPKD